MTGMISRTSKASFESKIEQIVELMKEKEDLYNLENITSDKLFTSSIKQSILGEYYSSDENKRKLDIDCEYTAENGIEMILVYKKSEFTKEQIDILKGYGAIEM